MSNYNFLDMLMGKANQATQKDPNQLLSPAKRFGKGLDELVLRGYGIGDQIVEQANKQAAFDMQNNQTQDTIKGLEQRAAAGDKAAASLLMAVQNKSLTPSDAMKIYFRQQFQKPSKTTMQMTGAQLNARDGKYAIIKMPSGETRMILITCLATIGSVSNPEHNLTVSGKAGRTRWLGRRPRVRPVVMNPVDHPMGGGEGKNSGGHPRSRNGIPAKGYKTRAKSKYSDKFIIERRKK